MGNNAPKQALPPTLDAATNASKLAATPDPYQPHFGSNEELKVFIDEQEMLRRIPVSRRTLFAWRESGKIPFVRLSGSRRVIFHWPSVVAALLRMQMEAKS